MMANAIGFRVVGIDSILDLSLCFGNCVLLYGSIIVVTLVIHQALRIFSAPPTMHNAVNVAGTILLCIQCGFVAVDSIQFFILFGSMALLLLMVQWQFLNIRKAVEDVSLRDFDQIFTKNMKHMEDWQLSLCILHFVAIAIYLSSLLVD